MKKITLQEAVSEIFKSKGKIFYVEFVKRTTNELRRMTCRLGVKSYLHGGTLKFSPKERNLLVVFDMDKRDYRMINLSGLKKISIRGKEYKITERR